MDELLHIIWGGETPSPYEVGLIDPRTLAFVGVAAYHLLVRSYLVRTHHCAMDKMNTRSKVFVSAAGQARASRLIEELLLEEETAVFKRGRNAKSNTVPKNMSIIDYRYATGFEALIGFLYLKKNFSRLEEIMNLSIESVGND
jgi:ribonuclease-3 family protein